MAAEFAKWVNVPEVIPDDFDEDALLQAALEADSIPGITVNHSQAQYFSCLFVLEEVIDIKNNIRSHSPSGMGWDRTSYDLFMALPNNLLLMFFNCCLETRANYHLIGLESCLLKMFTLLLDRHVHLWIEDNHILPESQNGFRRGYHAMNNPFILRMAIDKALAEGQTLYVAFPDLTNAFPSTDHASL
ncbi:uncharacterized protein EV420DRAFT_1265412 [Desarmillaria tabescens]|uniref:Reverse transcriptase domain-containing protein n=1 Tax=Armillaria tabescens TaxID=1929756 RepID=A0AA39NB92_ARMTA|nr:uncharacterized protein EV420DRAFT_1265412 [Desarmillaria tabescens]KAK0462353.1 hypothetical protein EV420DRAFT_1265412 [Desarmillaria tabescens]